MSAFINFLVYIINVWKMLMDKRRWLGSGELNKKEQEEQERQMIPLPLKHGMHPLI